MADWRFMPPVRLGVIHSAYNRQPQSSASQKCPADRPQGDIVPSQDARSLRLSPAGAYSAGNFSVSLETLFSV